MKTFFIKFSSQTVILLTLLTLVFSPFEPLMAQAQFSPTNNTGGIGPAGSQQNTTAGSDFNVIQNVGTTQVGPLGSFSNAPSGASAGNVGLTSTGVAGTQGGVQTFSPTSQAVTTPPPTQTPTPTSNCQIWGTSSGKGFVGDATQCLTDIIYVFTVGIGSFFAYVASYFFDFAVQLSLNGSAYALNFVSQGWTTARDIANMAFLFILIYIAFLVMFEAESSGTLHMLAAVIIVALLVNFSFFFTRLVIDAGNILSIQFYNAIQVGPVTSANQTLGSASTANIVNGVATYTGVNAGQTKDLTAGIMGMLNLQGILSNPSFKAFQDSNNYGFLATFISLTCIYIAAAILMWGLTVVFITAGVKFLFRIVVLWFLIIASPLAFIAYAIPNDSISGYFKKWRSLLIEHSFYPAVFMFIFLMLTNFSSQMSCNLAGGGTQPNCSALLSDIYGGLANTGGGNANYLALIGMSVANVAIRLGFVIAILYIGLIASKKIGVMGAQAAESAGNRVGGWYSGIMKGGASWAAGAAYRNTGGWAANKLDRGLQGAAWANNTDKFTKNPLGWAGGVLGYRLRRNVTQPLQATSLGTVASTYKERQAFIKDRKSEMTSNQTAIDNKKRIANTETIIEANKKAGVPAETGIKPEDLDHIQHLGKTQLEAMSTAQIKNLTAVFTESQMKIVKELPKLTEKEKSEADMKWENEARSSAYRKSNKEIDELRKINDKLSGPYKVAEISTTIGTLATPLRGVTIDATAVNKMLTDSTNGVEHHISRLDSLIGTETSAGRDTTALRQEKNLLQKAAKSLEKLEESRGNIRANVGGEADAGKFKTV